VKVRGDSDGASVGGYGFVDPVIEGRPDLDVPVGSADGEQKRVRERLCGV